MVSGIFSIKFYLVSKVIVVDSLNCTSVSNPFFISDELEDCEVWWKKIWDDYGLIIVVSVGGAVALATFATIIAIVIKKTSSLRHRTEQGVFLFFSCSCLTQQKGILLETMTKYS